MDDRLTICDTVYSCADCPRMGDDCDGRHMTVREAIDEFKEELEIFGGEHAEAMRVAIEVMEEYLGGGD